MFAQNRLITPKEQALLLCVIGAVVLGCATLYWKTASSSSGEQSLVVPASPPSASIPRESAVVYAPTALPSAAAHSPSPAIVAAAPEPIAAAPEEPCGVAIDGAVVRPGLYFLAKGARVSDLIEAAGGLRAHADVSTISLTAPLMDETSLTIPEAPVLQRGEAGASLRYARASAPINPQAYLKRKTSAVTPTHVSLGTASPPLANLTNPAAPLDQHNDGDSLVNLNQATSAQLQTLPGIGPALAERIVAARDQQPFLSVEDLLRVPGIGDKRLEAVRALVTAP